MVDLAERFWARVPFRGEGCCWEWRGTRNNKGYGSLVFERKRYAAHRVSVELSGRTYEPGQVTDHLCRNPSCVNPAHLEIVSNRENVLRGIAGLHRAIERAAATHCPRGHPLSGENLRLKKNGHRECWTCRREIYQPRLRDKRREQAAAKREGRA